MNAAAKAVFQRDDNDDYKYSIPEDRKVDAMATKKTVKRQALGNGWSAIAGAVVTGVVLIAFFLIFAPAIGRQPMARIEAGPVKIDFDRTAKIATPTLKVLDALSHLKQDQREFLLAHDEFDFDPVCLDPRSSNPADTAEDQSAQRDRAAHWAELWRLKLADERDPRTPLAWCPSGQAKTFHITALGQETRNFLVDTIFRVLKIDAS